MRRGGDNIAEITKLTGINDHGQVTAQGLIKGEFGEYLTPGVSNWDPAVATDPACPNSDPGVWTQSNGCGIPLLLDTMSLSQVLEGDVDDDGLVTNLDITPFIDLLTAAASDSAAIPEPASVMLLLPLMAMRRARRGGSPLN